MQIGGGYMRPVTTPAKPRLPLKLLLMETREKKRNTHGDWLAAGSSQPLTHFRGHGSDNLLGPLAVRFLALVLAGLQLQVFADDAMLAPGRQLARGRAVPGHLAPGTLQRSMLATVVANRRCHCCETGE